MGEKNKYGQSQQQYTYPQKKKFKSQQTLQTISKNVAIILFLAHEGVTQSSLWEDWKEDAFSNTSAVWKQQNKIKFLVHSPDNVEYGRSFCRKYKLDIAFHATSWCSPSLVYEYIRCLRHIVENDIDFKNADHASIFLVSGMDIPISSGKKFFVQNSLYIKQNHFCIINRKYHSQWISMNKKTILLFVEFFDDDKMKKILLSGLTTRMCADENILLDFIEYNKNVNETQLTSCTTRDWRDKKGSNSPILWNNISEKKLVTYSYPKAMRITLMDAIRFARSFMKDGDDTMFFRKVGPDCQFNVQSFAQEFWNPNMSHQDFKIYFSNQMGQIQTKDSQRSIQSKNIYDELRSKYYKKIEKMPVKNLVQLNFDYPLLLMYLQRTSNLLMQFMSHKKMSKPTEFKGF